MLRVATSRLPSTLCQHAPVLSHAAGILYSSMMATRNGTLIVPRRLLSSGLFDSRRPPPLSSYPCKVENVVKPIPPDQWISDSANVLVDKSRASVLNEQLKSLNADTGAEFAIVTLQDLATPNDYGTTPSEAYGRFCKDLFDDWGIGRVGVNDGLLLVVFVQGQRVEIISGKGLCNQTKKLQEHELGIMQRNVMIPLFSKGDHGGAIEAGTRALVHAVRESTLPTNNSKSVLTFDNKSESTSTKSEGFGGGSRSHYNDDGSRDGNNGSSNEEAFWNYTLYALLFGTATLAGYTMYTKGKHWCTKCGAQMTITPRKTIEPTFNSSGQGLLEGTCEHCGHCHLEKFEIPRLVEVVDDDESPRTHDGFYTSPSIRGSSSDSSIPVRSSGGSSISSKSSGSSSGGFSGGSSSGGSSAGGSW